MEIILLERIAKLGQMGEIVRVKDGFARNFLLPHGKALRATEANKRKFEGQRVVAPERPGPGLPRPLLQRPARLLFLH